MPNDVQIWLTLEGSQQEIDKVFQKMQSTNSIWDFNCVIPEPKKDPDFNWYVWRVEHWGTKWNAYDCYREGNTISFKTAWSIPAQILETLSSEFFNLVFTITYIEEVLESAGELKLSGGTTINNKKETFHIWAQKNATSLIHLLNLKHQRDLYLNRLKFLKKSDLEINDNLIVEFYIAQSS